jgi:hypothetical protein
MIMNIALDEFQTNIIHISMAIYIVRNVVARTDIQNYW